MTHPIRARLKTGNDLLKSVAATAQVSPDVSERLREFTVDVDAILAPGGHRWLYESQAPGSTSALSLTMTRPLKDDLKRAEKEFASPLAGLVEEGFRAALGGWLPSEMVKQKSRTEQERQARVAERAVLQLQVDDALRKEVEKKIPDMIARAGYRVTVSSIAVSWMADQLGVRRPGEGTQPLLLQQIPRVLVAHWVSVAEERGVTVDSVLEDGIRALRDGSWEMPRPVRSPKGSAADQEDVKKLALRVDADLLDYVIEQAPVLTDRYGVKVFPNKIALAILNDRLGQPAPE